MNMKTFSDIAEIKTKLEQCEIHGSFDSHLVCKLPNREIWSGCSVCANEAKSLADREAAEKAKIEKHNRWQRALGEAGIPDRFHSRTLDGYVATSKGQESALRFATEYANDFANVQRTGRSAIFCGKPGTGKTHLSVGIGLKVMNDGCTVLFTTVQRMMRRVKDAWRKDSTESESMVVDLFSSPDLLIVDEIGVQFGSDFEKNMMFDILNERYECRRPTLLLTNLTPSEVKSFLGERIFDRLREDGGQCVPFDWASHRGKV
ncbi:MAG TPA: ATP-binding protein [Gallionellaceae bacterium]|jgi:DNA replication protein DnaC|nr:ATP-binding protein [Gallionellaceae bacterium]